MWKLILVPGEREWLYEGPRALHRARFAAKLMIRRLGLAHADIVPYGGFVAEPIRIKR